MINLMMGRCVHPSSQILRGKSSEDLERSHSHGVSAREVRANWSAKRFLAAWEAETSSMRLDPSGEGSSLIQFGPVLG